MTRVIHIKEAPKNWQSNPEYVYVGRAGKGQDGYYGNPFKLSPQEPRGATLGRFKEYALNRIATDHEYSMRILGLKNKTLICFCAPNGGLPATEHGAICHGQILAFLADTLWIV